MIRSIALRTLGFLLWFGSVSAIAGGILGVFANGAGVPQAYLSQTPFTSYLVPGLLLGIVVGGTQLSAAILLLRRHSYSLMASAFAGFGMIVWIFVELAVITEYSPLQTVYLGLGVAELVLVLVALGLLNPFREPARESARELMIRPWIAEEP